MNGDSIHPLQLGGAGGGNILFVWSRSYYCMYSTMPAWTTKRWYLGWLLSQALNIPSEDQNDLLALTPAMFIQDVQVVGLLDLDCIDKVNFPRRFRYQPCLWEKLTRRFKVSTWVSSSNIGMRFYVTDNKDWSSHSYWWWQQEEDRLAHGKSYLSVPKKGQECRGW